MNRSEYTSRYAPRHVGELELALTTATVIVAGPGEPIQAEAQAELATGLFVSDGSFVNTIIETAAHMPDMKALGVATATLAAFSLYRSARPSSNEASALYIKEKLDSFSRPPERTHDRFKRTKKVAKGLAKASAVALTTVGAFKAGTHMPYVDTITADSLIIGTGLVAREARQYLRRRILR